MPKIRKAEKMNSALLLKIVWHSPFFPIGGWDRRRSVVCRYGPIGGDRRQTVILVKVVKIKDIFLSLFVIGSLSSFRREGLSRNCGIAWFVENKRRFGEKQ